MDREKKKKVMEKYGIHEKDTGSSKVQVAILTERITELTDHLEKHPKDDHSRRGLLGLVGKRRKHLNYLKMHRAEDYEEIVKKMKLRK
jgi:small subunit ribosomal protein S15